MKIVITKDHKESCRKAADIIIDVVNSNPNATLGLATGGTAEQVYDELTESFKQKKVSFKNVKTINLDEYVGLSPDHEQSYQYFMNKFLFSRVDIDKNNTFVPAGNKNPEEELIAFQTMLNQHPRDFQLLGIGVNGHIAFNEPAGELRTKAHIVDISQSTITANARYFDKREDVPKQAFTQGMGDVFSAKKIVLLASGAEKADAVKALILGDIVNTWKPCSFLKLHSDLTVFIDQELADLIGYEQV